MVSINHQFKEHFLIKMKRILFITPFTPSTLGAGVNYTRQLLEDLSNYFKIDLVYFRNKEDKPYEPLNSNISIKKITTTSFMRKLVSVLSLPFGFPLFTAKFSLSILSEIRKLTRNEKYDFIYLDFSQMFIYGKFLKGYNMIFMAHDIIGQRYERRNYLLGKWAKLSEKWVLKDQKQIFTFSKKDSRLLKKWYNQSSKVTSFYFEENVKKAFPSTIGNYFVFFAMWKRADNYEGLKWFMDNILPDIRDINFKIIGASLPQFIIDEISHYPNIEYLGFIDNPYPIITNSKALISPLFQGAGVKVKVLDAIATGTPVIGTDVSFEGIDPCYEQLMLRANNKEDFISSIKHVDIDINTRKKIKNQFLEEIENKAIIQYLKES